MNHDAPHSPAPSPHSRHRPGLRLFLPCCLVVLLCLPGCARFQKIDVEREFKHFITLFEELSTFTEAVFLLDHSKVITGELRDFFQQKIYETKLQLESVIDIIFFYKYSDFRNFENYQVVYRYVNQRLDTISLGLQAQDKIIATTVKDYKQTKHLRRYTKEYREYLGRIIAQIEELKEKTK